jgi:predicted  nucleic acid-binding Zn-ribbon protein
MTDETPDTLHLPSFEEKVLSQLESLDGRLASLEKREEERAYDTKPIWNRVLTELTEVKTDVSELKTDVSGLKADVSGLKADISGLKTDMSGLKTEVSELHEHMRSFDRKLDIVNKDLLQVKADLYGREMR